MKAGSQGLTAFIGSSKAKNGELQPLTEEVERATPLSFLAEVAGSAMTDAGVHPSRLRSKQKQQEVADGHKRFRRKEVRLQH